MSKVKGFIFNYSKCVGCHACMVACSVENSTKPPLSWRNVESFNPEKLPLAGFVNLSIACNHCKEAPCLKSCPTKAYSFDHETDAVIHNPELCIGCKYCSWVCPFDAPKYNPSSGIIEKCHFCYHRLKENKIPACALNCPTGALSFGDITEKSNLESVGLSKKSIFPRIQILGEESFKSIPTLDISVTGFNKNDLKKLKIFSKTSIVNPLSEWPLVFFTFIGSILTAYIWAFPFKNTINIPFWLFLSIGSLGIFLSTIHLGKPFKAYLSIKNIKTSWLSREVLLYGLFMLSGVIAIWKDVYAISIFSGFLGIAFLVAIEMVYSINTKKIFIPLHSANTFAIAITFAALFAQSWHVLIFIIALRTMLFTIRTGSKSIENNPYLALIAFIRLTSGFLIPFGLFTFKGIENFWVFAGFIILGELIDRFMYYEDIKLERPFSNT